MDTPGASSRTDRDSASGRSGGDGGNLIGDADAAGSGIVDPEVEDRIQEWLDHNRIEDATPTATLYRFREATGDAKDQCDYYKGLIPSRHEIGLQYGAGRYVLILRNTTAAKGMRGTTFRFTLHESYNDKAAAWKRERAEKERIAVPALPTPLPPPGDGKTALMDALAMIQMMQNSTLSLFRPLLERAISPPALPQPAKSSIFEEYSLTRDILKHNLKENVAMFNAMQRNLTEGRSIIADGTDEDDSGELAPDKKSLFEKIIALAEPFISLLSNNSMAARAAAAGIRAAPQFKEVLQDAGLARRIIAYVENKEGRDRAEIALRNLGIQRSDYVGDAVPAARIQPSAPQMPATMPARPPAARRTIQTKGRTK